MSARQIKEAAKEFYCGIFSITAGAQIMSVILILLSIGIEVATITTQTDAVVQVVVAVIVFIQLVSALLVLLAIRMQRSKLMAPAVAFCVLLLIGLVVIFILLLIKLIHEDLEFEEKMNLKTSGDGEFAYIFCSIFFVIVYFFIVLWSFINFTFCHKHLQNLERKELLLPLTLKTVLEERKENK